MNIWILDKDPKEIKIVWDKDKLTQTGYYRAFSDGKQVFLNHTHEVDIDEMVQEWLHYKTDHQGRIPFSQFLQEQLNQGGKE